MDVQRCVMLNSLDLLNKDKQESMMAILQVSKQAQGHMWHPFGV